MLKQLANLGTSLLGGLSSLGSQLIQRKTDQQNMQRQNDLNMRMADYQYDKQVQMWNMANEYNSPQAQMKRFTEAGLNPNLIYGQGNPGNTPNVLPQYKAPDQNAMRKEVINPLEILNATMMYKIQSQQLENLKADRRRKELEIEYNTNRNFYSGDYFGYKNRQMFYNLWKPKAEYEYAFGVTDENMIPRSEILQSFLAKWNTPGKILQNYNSQIALANARKDLLDLDIAWYAPKWAGGLAGSVLNFLKPRGVTRQVFKPNKGTATKPFSKVLPNFNF